MTLAETRAQTHLQRSQDSGVRARADGQCRLYARALLTQARTQAETCALSVLLNRTMADRDGCSGFWLLKDYVNGSRQHTISQ